MIRGAKLGSELLSKDRRDGRDWLRFAGLSTGSAPADTAAGMLTKIMMLPRSALLTAALACSGLAGCDDAGRGSEPTRRAEPQPGSAPAGPDGIQIAYAIDGDTISVEGKVLRIEGPRLLLDYGTGEIPVVLKGGALSPDRVQIGDEAKASGIFNVRPDGPIVSAVELLVQSDGGEWAPGTSGPARRNDRSAAQ